MTELRYVTLDVDVTLTNQNCVLEEVRSQLHLLNACCHLIHDLLYFHLLFKSITIKVYRTIILPVD